MSNKTKVIAIRVTQEEYDHLVDLADELGNITFRKLFEDAIQARMTEAKELHKRRLKAFNAKQKRLAKKEAQNGVQS